MARREIRSIKKIKGGGSPSSNNPLAHVGHFAEFVFLSAPNGVRAVVVIDFGDAVFAGYGHSFEAAADAVFLIGDALVLPGGRLLGDEVAGQFLLRWWLCRL